MCEAKRSIDQPLDLPYQFNNLNYLTQALCHSSYVNEHPGEDLTDNERFEFLGDAVLNLVVGDLLMQRFPELDEGMLSRMRANLVNESQLAAIARGICLGDSVQLGKGELATQGREKNSILANAFEAVIAAVYLDGGFEAAYRLIENFFNDLLSTVKTSMVHLDYKSQLQEQVQLRRREIPVYQVIDEKGPDHEKIFVVRVKVQDVTAEGSGKSKKLAEQEAARRALKLLRQ